MRLTEFQFDNLFGKLFSRVVFFIYPQNTNRVYPQMDVLALNHDRQGLEKTEGREGGMKLSCWLPHRKVVFRHDEQPKSVD